MPSKTPLDSTYHTNIYYLLFAASSRLLSVTCGADISLIRLPVYSSVMFRMTFFLCFFTLFFLDQAFVAWLFWMVLKSRPCEMCLFPLTRHLTDSALNFNEALTRSCVSVPLVRQPSPECAQSTTVTLLLGYASIFPPIHLCRSSLANVSTTHVERAAIVVALVTTSKPGWQGPSTLGISVRVRMMYTNADYTLQLQQWLVQRATTMCQTHIWSWSSKEMSLSPIIKLVR